MFERYLPQRLASHLANIKYNAFYCSYLKTILNSTNQNNCVSRSDIIKQFEADFPRLSHSPNNRSQILFTSFEDMGIILRDSKSKNNTKPQYPLIDKK